MQDHFLTQQDLAELRAAHRAARNAHEAYRLNAAILLGSGWRASAVAAALLMDDGAQSLQALQAGRHHRAT